jgi:hypothetical protein
MNVLINGLCDEDVSSLNLRDARNRGACFILSSLGVIGPGLPSSVVNVLKFIRMFDSPDS